jgi:hypothetical protein
MVTLHTHQSRIIAATAVLLLTGVTSPASQTDNAALLYYQGCLLYEKPDETMTNILAEFRKGEIPANQAIRDHVEKNRRVIDYAVKAANLPNCDWGYDYTQGLDLTMPNLPTLRRVAFLLAADARLLADQGDWQNAVGRCLAIHRMGLHVADRPLVTYLMGMGLNALANSMMQEVLAVVPKDVETLRQIEAQVTQVQDAFPSVATAIEREAQLWTVSMRKEQTESILRMLKESANPDNSESIMAQIRTADEGFFARSRSHWTNAIAELTATLQSGLPYEQMCTKLDELGTRLANEGQSNPDATLTAFALPATSRVFVLATRLQTHFHALRTALDIYTIRAQTGKLPDSLPPNSRPDLFSGKPFLYEKADDHFVLRCQVKEYPDKAEANHYEFKIAP